MIGDGRVVVVFLLGALFLTETTAKQAKRRVLMVSFDGFRWDYLNYYKAPNFQWLAETGCSAPRGMRPAFATKTFPDHYTMVTGLYEESHGIVSNKMYDPEFKETFNMGNIETKWWDGGEPIWITAKLQGLKTAAFFWPGSEVKLRNVYPDEYVPYDKKTPFPERVDTVIRWLKEKNVDIVVSYFHEPDAAGHHYGVLTPQVEAAVKLADETLGYLLEKLREIQLIDSIDLLVLSDHGMTNVTHDDEHLIDLSKYIDLQALVERIPQDGAIAHILPRPGKIDEVYQKLSKAHAHMTVYKKEDIPEHYHYKHHRRIMPIFALADEGYYISQQSTWGLKTGVGEHGYDNDLQSMKPIFFARGPDFKVNHTVKTFDTVSIYPLLCHLLGVNPAPNNGTLAEVSEMLVSNAPSTLNTASIYPYIPVMLQFLRVLF